MKVLWAILKAIPAPFYAVFAPLDREYQVNEEHVSIWFMIAFFLTAVALISSIANTFLGGLEHFISKVWRAVYLAYFSTLACRLAVAEQRLKELKSDVLKEHSGAV
jgi:hypothetical protein